MKTLSAKLRNKTKGSTFSMITYSWLQNTITSIECQQRNRRTLTSIQFLQVHRKNLKGLLKKLV